MHVKVLENIMFLTLTTIIIIANRILWKPSCTLCLKEAKSLHVTWIKIDEAFLMRKTLTKGFAAKLATLQPPDL